MEGRCVMYSILIVDDNTDLLKMMQRNLVLAREGFSVLTAENGLAALDILGSREVSLVITDLNMPKMDGFELLARIIETYPQIPVIVMTSLEPSAIKDKVINMGAIEFLSKPIVPSHLLMQVRKILDEHGESATIRNISLLSFLQLLGLERKTCTLSVRGPQKTQALFYLKDGDVLDIVSSTGKRGREVLFETMAWNNPKLILRDNCPLGENHIRTPIQNLLLEAAVRSDNDQRNNGPATCVCEEPAVPETEPEIALNDMSIIDREVEEIFEKNPTAMELLEIGFDHYRADRLQLAYRLWKKALEQTPDNKILMFNLRKVEMKLQRQQATIL